MPAPADLAQRPYTGGTAAARVSWVGALALRVLLAVLGQAMAVASRLDPATRQRITRDLVMEISSADGVCRHWVFDGSRRRVTTRAGHAPRVDCALRLRSGGQGVRVLLSPHAMGRIIEELQAGALRAEGNFVLFLWFYGLTRRIAPIGRQHRPWRALPHPYLAHDPSSPAAAFITIEPPQHELDPSWSAAWEQRAKLLITRVVEGEPVKEF